MLPDYPEFSKLFRNFCNRLLRERTERRMGPLYHQIQKRRQFEGARSRIQRPNEPVEENEYFGWQDSISYQLSEIPFLSLEDVVSRIDAMAERMAASIGKGMYGSMDRILEKHGRVGKGKLSPETILASIENTEISFENGEPGLQLVISPSMSEEAKEAIRQLAEDPDLIARSNELMAKKWEEWRARESDRGLD